MSKYVLVENQGGDAAALYDTETGKLLEARHIDDVRESLLTRFEEQGLIEVFNAPTMPSDKHQWSDTYSTVSEFRATLDEED